MGDGEGRGVVRRISRGYVKSSYLRHKNKPSSAEIIFGASRYHDVTGCFVYVLRLLFSWSGFKQSRLSSTSSANVQLTPSPGYFREVLNGARLTTMDFTRAIRRHTELGTYEYSCLAPDRPMLRNYPPGPSGREHGSFGGV